jgi:protein-disulfide isomerase
MPLVRALGQATLLGLVNLNVATCRSTADGEGAESSSRAAHQVVDLEGVDTSKLTDREKQEWSAYVTEQLAPCPDQPVSVAQCIQESRPCDLCRPAARFLASHVTRGRSRTQVETAYRIRFGDEVKNVEVGDSPFIGPADAAVTIVEWADFECPFCGAAAPLLEKAQATYPKHVRLVFKNYPLAMHEHAETAARASVAAERQGKFWEMHHALFKSQSMGLERPLIEQLAKELGLDTKRFIADLESESVADAVLADRKQAEKLGVRGTPMIYVNGRHFEIELFSLVEDLEEWLALEIEVRTGQRVEPVPAEVGQAKAPPSASATAGD